MSRFLLAALWVLAALLLGQGVYMEAKAKLAQILISSSWEQRSGDRPPPKPWWWADTRAIATISAPRLDKTVYVMQDASGESLAFGPGHISASAPPASDGHVMIAGHRDSHFAFLQDVRVGDVIETSDYQAHTKRYQVREVVVIDSEHEAMYLNDANQLSLITCYPFSERVPGGSLRYIVNADEIIEVASEKAAKPLTTSRLANQTR